MGNDPYGSDEAIPRPGHEDMVDPQMPDSEGYLGDSERYQEDGEPPRPARDDRPPAARDDFAEEWMPDVALGNAVTGSDGLEPERREWQVNVRLDRERYAALRSAADAYGTTPTALARMLLNRGSTAILNAHRAEMAAFEWADPRG